METGAGFKFLPATEELRETFGGVDSQTGEKVSATALLRIDILNEKLSKAFCIPVPFRKKKSYPPVYLTRTWKINSFFLTGVIRVTGQEISPYKKTKA